LTTPQPEPGSDPAAGRNSSSPGCLIKGNINDKGVKIYHLPGGREYEHTRIRPERGERWFCTEAEAREAGWRAAR
jgi:hypothetical protein